MPHAESKLNAPADTELPPSPPALDPQEVRLSRTRTWSGTETDAFYGPGASATAAYAEQLGDPGQFPFTRG
ncbi:MAG: hypothetical protein ABIP06_04840, partial [Pyrinomonadaceae bacterium]